MTSQEQPTGHPAPPSVGALSPAGRAVADLIDPLVDACTRPSGEHFDELVATAVAAGELSPELAHRLRYWQRASVHEIGDQLRLVLPAVLPTALEASRTASRAAAEAADAAEATWQGRDDAAERRPIVDPRPGAGSSAGTSAPAEHSPAIDLRDSDSPIADESTQTPATMPPEVVLSAPEDHEAKASSDAADTPPSSQQEPSHQAQLRRRLFIAGLTSTA